MLAVTLLPGFSVGQANDLLKVMVVDTQKIYREAVALRQLADKLSSKRSAYLNELRAKEKELRVADRELAGQRSALSSEEFSQRHGALEQQMFTPQRALQSRKRAIDQHFEKAMERLQAQLSKIIEEIAERREADLVLAKNALIVTKPGLEITEEALLELNRRPPRFDFPAEEN